MVVVVGVVGVVGVVVVVVVGVVVVVVVGVVVVVVVGVDVCDEGVGPASDRDAAVEGTTTDMTGTERIAAHASTISAALLARFQRRMGVVRLICVLGRPLWAGFPRGCPSACGAARDRVRALSFPDWRQIVPVIAAGR